MSSIHSSLGGLQQATEQQERTTFLYEDSFVDESLRGFPFGETPLAEGPRPTLFADDQTLPRISEFGLRQSAVAFSYVQSEGSDTGFGADNNGLGVQSAAVGKAHLEPRWRLTTSSSSLIGSFGGQGLRVPPPVLHLKSNHAFGTAAAAVARRSVASQKALALLDSWIDEDASGLDPDDSELGSLQTRLDEDRYSNRKLFP